MSSSDSTILIGCPVYKRAKVLPIWFKAIEEQTWPLDQVGFVFEAAPDDPETHEVLMDFQSRHPELIRFDIEENTFETHEEHLPRARSWNTSKYHKMSRMRNNLLEKMRAYRPDKYLSLDTDIVMENPGTIETLVAHTDQGNKDAVSPLAYMYPKGNTFPNVMSWKDQPGGRASRMLRNYPLGRVFQSDIIMAAVMMTPRVYDRTCYRPHPQGEDLGWSHECWKHDCKLYLVSNIYCPHLMYDYMVDDYLESGDPRSPLT